jgi:hypothetical protein
MQSAIGFTRKLGMTSLAALLLCSCQVYRNNGRGLFEAAAPSQVSGPIGSPQFPILSKEADSSTDCWSQPKNEPLWFAKENKEYRVHFIDDQSIEVCFEDSEIPHPTAAD